MTSTFTHANASWFYRKLEEGLAPGQTVRQRYSEDELTRIREEATSRKKD